MQMFNNIYSNTLMSISGATLSFFTAALPLLQLIAILVAIVSGAGAIHLTILKIVLLKQQTKSAKNEKLP